MHYDVAILNGRIIDGMGNPSFTANVYLNTNQIALISRRPYKADTVIEAKGLVVVPGFIDIHQHSDFSVFANTGCLSFVHQGVTTASIGNCGLALAPLGDDYVAEIKHYNRAFTFGYVIPYTWRSFEEYLDVLNQTRVGLNLWPQVGHCTLRAAVMGYVARPASKSELQEMKTLLHAAMGAGACALSTGAYAPAYWAETNELIELAKVVAEYEGLYTTHLRRFGVQEAFEIGEKAGIPVEIAHYSGAGVQEARQRGIDVTYNAYPYTAGSSFLGQLLPSWLYEGGVDAMLERIQRTQIREKIRESPQVRARYASNCQSWHQSYIAFLPTVSGTRYEGQSIGEIVHAEAVDPVDWICEQLLAHEGDGMYIHRNGRRESYVFNTLRDPNSHVMSDGWAFASSGALCVGKPHPRCYGTYPRILGWYVRDCNIFSLPEAIRKMTSAPALKMGISDRGILREGYQADITIFNPTTVNDRASYEHPHQYPQGIEYVLINGELVIQHGEHTGVLAGKLIRNRWCTPDITSI